MSFQSDYQNLLIKQYWEKPKAKADIAALAENFEKIRDAALAFETEFDIDLATGDRLDKIGAIVGINRIVEGTQLSDDDYRFFIRAKIAKNYGSPYLIDGSGLSISDAVRYLFEGAAYVIDNQNMTLTLYVSSDFDAAQLAIINALNLIPKPQGVGYNIISYSELLPFGFSDNPAAQTFGVGVFSTKVI